MFCFFITFEVQSISNFLLKTIPNVQNFYIFLKPNRFIASLRIYNKKLQVLEHFNSNTLQDCRLYLALPVYIGSAYMVCVYI